MAKKRGGLGRGLESLFEDTAPSFESDNRIETLPLREIEPDPAQPRKTFDEETLAELAASISEHGLLQPIAVRPHGVDRYLIVAGERRWRACRMAGLTEAPVVVKDVTDEQAMELALVENLQREDLDPVEEALGIRELMTRCDLTQEQAARKLGKSRSALANSLRLLNLPETVLELLKGGFLTTGHAKVVLGLPTPELQEQPARRNARPSNGGSIRNLFMVRKVGFPTKLRIFFRRIRSAPRFFAGLPLRQGLCAAGRPCPSAGERKRRKIWRIDGESLSLSSPL